MRTTNNHSASPIRQLILPLYLPAAFIIFSQSMLIPFFPLYLRDFDISYGAVGIIVSTFGIGTILTEIPGGLLVNRIGTRNGMIIGLGLLSISTTAIYWAKSIPEIVIYWTLAGAGNAFIGLTRHTILANTLSNNERGRAIALMGGAFRVGRMFGPVAGGFFAGTFDLRGLFLLTGVVGMVSVGLVIVFLRTHTSRTVHESYTLRGTWQSIQSSSKVFLTAGSGHLLAQMTRAGRILIIPLYGTDALGLNVEELGILESTAAILEMLMFFPAGIVMDRFGRKYATVPSFLTQGIGLMLIPLTGGFGGLLVVAILIGIGNGLSSGTMLTLGADLSPPSAQSQFLGLWRLIGDVGDFSGPLVVGTVADILILPMSALFIGGVGITAGLIFLFLVPETLERAVVNNTVSQ